MDTVCYRIDAADTLVTTDDGWFEFAAKNEFSNPNVVGTSLWQHITDSTTAQIYKGLLERARRTTEPITLSFRCDAPTLRRFMFMEMTADPDGNVQFRCTTKKTENRALLKMLRASLPDSSDIVKMCSWCNRIQVQGRWSEIESAVDTLGLLLAEEMPTFSHSICVDCEQSYSNGK